MFGFHHHGNAARLQHVANRVGDLRIKMFLGLQAQREHFDQARELRQADDTFGRQIGDVRGADERHHVMFAVRVKRNVAHQHHVVVAAGLRERAVEDFVGAVAIAAEQFLIGRHDPARRIEQALAGRIVAGIGDQGFDGGFGFLTRRTDQVRTGIRRQTLALLGRRVHGRSSVRPMREIMHTGCVTGSGAGGLQSLTGPETRTLSSLNSGPQQ